MPVKGYKMFDENWNTMNMFHWMVGETYTHEGELKMCKSGFHFCKRISDLHDYIPVSTPFMHACNGVYDTIEIADFTKLHVAEVESLGTVLDGEYKSITDKIRIVREIPTSEFLDMVNIGKYNYGFKNTGENNVGNNNSGSYNIGYSNTASYCNGNFNAGKCNIGYNNTGKNNVGYNNAGDGNLGNYNNGMWCKGKSIPHGSLFCTNSDEAFKFPDEIRIFNKTISADDISIDFVKIIDQLTWREYISMKLLMGETKQFRRNKTSVFYYELAALFSSTLSLTTWIPEDKMSNKEKEEHPYYSYTKGYLLTHSYEDMWKEFWENPSDDCQRVKDIIKALPGFDPDIFKKITGIEV